MLPSCATASARSSGFCSPCAAFSSRSLSPDTMNERRMRRFTSTSVVAPHLAQNRARLGPAMDAEILNRLVLKIRRRRSLGIVPEHFPRPRRIALRQHEQRPLFTLGDAVPSSVFSRIGTACSCGTCSAAPAARAASPRRRRSPAGEPAARCRAGLRPRAPPPACGRDCSGSSWTARRWSRAPAALAQPVLGERLPVERAVHLAALQLDDAVEELSARSHR